MKTKLKLLFLFLMLFNSCNSNLPNTSTETTSFINEDQKNDSLKGIKDIISKLEKDFEIKISFLENDNASFGMLVEKISVNKDNAPIIHLQIEIFENEIRKYPLYFFKEIGLKRIVFIKKINFPLFAGALTNPYDKTIYLPIEDVIHDNNFELNNYYIKDYYIHHEIFHMIEDKYSINDDEWQKTNSQPHFYPWIFNNLVSHNEEYSSPGFINDYSMSSPGEDRAEIYNILFDSYSNLKFKHKILDGDNSLQKKADFIKSYIENHFPDMNNTYFDLVSLGLKSNELNSAMKDPNKITKIDLTQLIRSNNQINNKRNLSSVMNPSLKMINSFINLQSLILPEFDLINSPISIKNFQKLEEIDISSNNLTEIPIELFSLKNLKFLNLSNNPIKNISGQIKNLEHLETLVLSDTKIENLPSELGFLNKLQRLDITNNSIKEFPESFNNLNLKVFNYNNYVDSIKLSQIPDFVLNSELMEEISFYNHNLSAIPEKLKNLSNLREIYLSKNKINSLDFDFSKFKNLQVVDLSNNNISVDERTKNQELYPNINFIIY